MVAVLTYLRPDDLLEALSAVQEQVDGREGPTSVLVIDNDPEGSAMHLQERFPVDRVRFVHEATPGISAARNRALDEAGDADVLVFIDDDERPEPGWLRHMVETWQRTGATAVAGPVISVFGSEPDPWVTASGHFARPRFPTGTDLVAAGTGNLLLDLRRVHGLGLRFDPRFAATGGGDTLFTRQIRRAGDRLVSCDEAVVHDVVRPSRLTRRWLVRRWYRSASNWSRVALELEVSPMARGARRVVLTGQGLGRVATGVARFLAGVVTASVARRATGARRVVRGLGMTAGAWGLSYNEYKRPS